MRKPTPQQLAALGWALLIFVLSSIPKLPTIPAGFRAIDKVAHFVEYFIFGILLAGAFAHSSEHRMARRTMFSAGFLGLTYAILDEIHQKFVPGRFAAAEDVVADALGLGVSLVVYHWWHQRYSRPTAIPKPSSDEALRSPQLGPSTGGEHAANMR
ncbi:MAG: VanZ family protein [candidate division KSB1 bacterium]|nr:VanZ family protein [candidate division KSB1 bacterium]MDZ7378767.1 VanZ family protein [candidate division KSB1 bacterium]MDZ7392498.1 VanZ family protein [candidate division KSB1 bacterium]